MTKKQEFLRAEQSRDQHPERDPVGSPAMKGEVADVAHPDKQQAASSKQQAGSGKLANDHNKIGNTEPTQTNQGKRTPESRHDRQTIAGGPHNQVTARKGGGGAGRTPRGAG